jgi:DivIVA domain-containing protein
MWAMELSPQAVAAATFKTVKRGYDPDEVRAYLVEVSASLESSHQQATAMEARARAAIAKLQDATQQGAVPANMAVPHEADTISRTLLLAQRTADTAIAEAQAEAAALQAQAEADAAAVMARAQSEAASITTVAKSEASTTVDQASVMAARLIEEARLEARRTKDDEHLRAEREVQALLARRQSLESDVDALEQYVSGERERLRLASATLLSLADASTGGLAAIVRPQLSAAADLPAPASSNTAANGTSNGSSNWLSSERMPPPASEPTITGQIPIVGAQPLVSPMPASNEEARSMWHEAELADDAASATDDTSPIAQDPIVDDAAPDDAASDDLMSDDSTPSEGLRIGSDELH